MIQSLLRRKFLAGIALGGTAVALHPGTRFWLTGVASPRSAQVPPLDGALRTARRTRAPFPPVDGVVREDMDGRELRADDFGHMVQRAPLAVLEPASVRDVQAIMRYANEWRIPIGVRGSGHSMLGQAQTSGILIDMSFLNDVFDCSSRSSTAAAGATWFDVVSRSVPLGFVPRLFPADLSHTLGGSLAVGGLTPSVSALGLVADHVIELDVVTGEGELVTCSEAVESDLFEAALAGFAQAGLGHSSIIVRAEIASVERPTSVDTMQFAFDDPSTFLRRCDELAAISMAHEVSGKIQPCPDGSWMYVLEVSVHSEPEGELAEALARLRHVAGSVTTQRTEYVTWLSRALISADTMVKSGVWDSEHPGLSAIFPLAGAGEVLARCLDSIQIDDLASLPVRVVPIRRRQIKRASFPAPQEEASVALYFDRFPRSADDVTRIMASNEDLVEDIRERGGTPFGVSSIPQTFDDTRRMLGEQGSQWIVSRKLVDDPNRVLLLDDRG